MPTIISCVNLKGGVGKTAIAVNVAAFFGIRGKKTLLIDLDPQTNATFSCISVDEWKTHSTTHGTVANLFGMRGHTNVDGSEADPKEVIRKAVFKNVDLLPSHLDLFTIDLDMGAATARETKLKRSLKDTLPDYEVVICDCPPNLTIPTQNAIALSTHYLVPVSPDYLSVLGVALLLTRVKKLSQELQHAIAEAGIVVSRVGRPAVHRAQSMTALEAQFGKSVFQQVIKERVSVSESAQFQKTIYEHDKIAGAEFEAVSIEVAQRTGLKL